MTEAEWLACEDPGRMLEFVRGKASDRKLRLFAAAYCRIIWDHYKMQWSRTAVEVAERHADRLATETELLSATQPADDARVYGGYAAEAAYFTASLNVEAVQYAASREFAPSPRLRAARNTHHAVLFRDLFGNPFRPKGVHPAWLSWNGGTVPKLAQAIYDDRAFDRLPILADALEDAGCSDAALLGHLRGGGEHFRGCWVLDLVLGKQ